MLTALLRETDVGALVMTTAAKALVEIRRAHTAIFTRERVISEADEVGNASRVGEIPRLPHNARLDQVYIYAYVYLYLYRYLYIHT
jgi:hypothetical protein